MTAQNGAGLSSSTSFTVTPDGTAPTSSIACDGSSCSGNWYTSSVAISLSAVDGASGLDVIRYTTDGSDPSPVNGTDYTAPFSVAATTTVKFRSYDKVGNEEAVRSQLVKIDDTAPSAPTLSVNESPGDPHQYVAGTTLYYNPQGGNSGSFQVGATTGDAQSGIDHVNFPALSGMTGGGDDTTSPYAGTYSWNASSNASGAQNVTSVNGAGLTAASSFTVTPDAAPPAGGSVDYVDGYASGSVTITTADGNDALSGVDAASGVIERDATALVNGACDPFTGAWTTVVSPDVTIASGNCYRYRYRVSDNVSNEAVYTSAHVVKVSTGAPSSPSLTLIRDAGEPEPARLRRDALLQPGRLELGRLHRLGHGFRLGRLRDRAHQLPGAHRHDRRRGRHDEPVRVGLRLERREQRLRPADGHSPQQRRPDEHGDVHGHAGHDRPDRTVRHGRGRLLHESLGAGHARRRR